MKKVFGLLLIFFLLFNSMGYYILFELDKLMVRKEMNARLSRTAADLICLTVEKGDKNPSFHRRGSREIEFRGKLYDVFREVDKGDSKVFICIRDTKEEQLYTGLKKISHAHQKSSLWDHMVKIALPEGVMHMVYPTPLELKFPPFRLLYSSSVLRILSPPPEVS